MAEEGQWTVVSRRRARRGKGGPPAAVGAEARCRPDHGQQDQEEQERQKRALPAWHQANLRAGYSEEEAEREAARLRAALEERKDAMAASAFYRRLEEEVRRRVRGEGEKEEGKERIAVLVCYGLGSVQSTTCNALWQLACLLLLREAFLPLESPHTPACADVMAGAAASDADTEAPMADTRAAAGDGDTESGAVAEVFDPAFDAVDRRLLRSLGFTVPSSNDAGKRQAQPPSPSSPTTDRQEDDGGGGGTTSSKRGGGRTDHHPRSLPPPASPQKALFFMPHCPRRLYSNLLWANWAPHALPSLVVAGNSLTSYVDRFLPSQKDQDPCDCLAPLLPLARETPIGWTTPARREGQAEEGKQMKAKETDLRALEAGASAAFMDFSVFDFPDVPPAMDTDFWEGQRPPEHRGPVSVT